MIMNIAAAAAARTPLLVLASNMQIAGDDREAFIQTGYQQPTTTGMKKYGKRLIAPDRVWEYGAYAFRNLKSGVPGPVHLDFPGEVARARFTDPSKLKDFYGKEKYRTESCPDPAPKDIQKAVDLINQRGATAARGGSGRVSVQGLGRAARGGREKRPGRRNHRTDARPLPGRSPAVRQPDARCADERGSRDLRGPVLHAEPGRVSFQPRREVDSRSSGCRRPGTQLALGPGNRQQRKVVPRSLGRRACHDASAIPGSANWPPPGRSTTR